MVSKNIISFKKCCYQVTPEGSLKLIYSLLKMPFYFSVYFSRFEVGYISKELIFGFGS